jgi:nucleoside-diphosphate-sugar epimerase
LVEGDITDPGTFDKITQPVDMVLHLAAKTGVRPSIENAAAYIKTNVDGTHNLLQWMKRQNIKKLVFASSSSVYGNTKKVPFLETDNVDNPISPYAATKKACELLNYTYHHLYQFDIINLRFFTVFGPRQRPDLAIRKFVEQIKAGQPVTVYGDGKSGRDYTYIDDITDGICSAIKYLDTHTGVYEVINLGNSSPVKLIELVNELYKLLGKEPQIKFEPIQEGDVDFTYAGIEKAQHFLGYAPKTTLREGLQKFIEWTSGLTTSPSK